MSFKLENINVEMIIEIGENNTIFDRDYIVSLIGKTEQELLVKNRRLDIEIENPMFKYGYICFDLWVEEIELGHFDQNNIEIQMVLSAETN